MKKKTIKTQGNIGFSKNRKHTIVLTEKAEMFVRALNKKYNGQKWLHRYISIKIVQDFEISPEILLVHKLSELQERRDTFDQEIEAYKTKAKEELDREILNTVEQIRYSRNETKKLIEKQQEIEKKYIDQEIKDILNPKEGDKNGLGK